MNDDRTAGTFLGWVLLTFMVLVTAVIVGALDGPTSAILAAAIGETYAM